MAGQSLQIHAQGFYAGLWADVANPGNDYPLISSGGANPNWTLSLHDKCLNFLVKGSWVHNLTCDNIVPGYNYYSVTYNTSYLTLTTNAKTIAYPTKSLPFTSLTSTFPLLVLGTVGNPAKVDQILIRYSDQPAALTLIAELTFDTNSVSGTSDYKDASVTFPTFFTAQATGNLIDDVPAYTTHPAACATGVICTQAAYNIAPVCGSCPAGYLGTSTTTCAPNLPYPTVESGISPPPDHLWHLTGDGSDSGVSSVPLTATSSSVPAFETLTTCQGLSRPVAHITSSVALQGAGTFNIDTGSDFSISLLFQASATGNANIVSVTSASLNLFLTVSSGVLSMQSGISPVITLGSVAISSDWHHAVFGFKGGRAIFVVDSVSVPLQDWGETIQATTTTATFSIGPAQNTFEAYASEIAFWTSYALTYDQQNDLYYSFHANNITFEAGIELDITTTPVSCPGSSDGSFTATASGTTSSVHWTFPDGTTKDSGLPQTYTNLLGGVYMYTIVDSGCNTTKSFTVPQPDPVTTDIVISPPCTRPDDAMLVATNVKGGTPPYTYKWSPDKNQTVISTEASVSGLVPGVYDLVIGYGSCVNSFTATIPTSTPIGVSTSHTDPKCHGGATGSASAVPQGGAGGNYQYVWQLNGNNVSTLQNVPNLSAGTYTLLLSASNYNTCVLQTQVILVDPAALTSVPSGADTSCYGASDGYVDAGIQGGNLTGVNTTWTLSNGSTTTTSSTRLTGLSGGQYNFSVVDGNGCSISGTYTISESTTCSTLNPPVFQQAKFAGDGLSFFITFDTSTNLGGKSLNTSFPCSAVLAPVTIALLDANAACTWISRTNLSVSTAGNATIRVGSPVALRDNTIYGNPAGRVAANGTLALLAPDNPVSPTLALNAPAQVGSCDDITISASTQGTLGKPTLNTWSVSASTTNTSALVAFLGSYTQLPATIPNTYLVPGAAYNFTLTVSNIFNYSATSTVSVSKSKISLPTVSIPGAAVIRTTAPQTLTVQGAIAISSNNTCQPNAALAWSWTVVRADTLALVKLPANVVNIKELAIPGGTLTADTNYTVTVTASYPTLNLSNSASATIMVQKSDLVGVIVGGNNRSSAVTQPLIVNATSSGDPDTSAGNLTYTWTCTVNGQPCVNITGGSLILPDTAALVFPPNTLASNLTYMFVLVVSSSDGRQTSTSVQIAMVSGTPPSVSVSAAGTSPIISSSSSLTLNGLVTPSTDVTLLWTETTGQLDLNNRDNLLTPRSNINLVIKPNVLQPGAKYTFMLQATNINGTGFASVDVAVSPLPHGGTCGVAPASGTPVTTQFTISCDGWEDSSTLTYTFSYLLGGTEVFLRTQLSESLVTALPLPAGGNPIVPILVRISNMYNATVTTTFNASVSLSSSDTNTAFVSQAYDQIAASLTQYGDPDASIQSLVALSSVLQATNTAGGSTTESNNLSQKIFTLFTTAASNLSTSSSSVEQQAGNIAVLSQSSAQWDDNSKSLLADSIHSYSQGSGDASTQALGSLLTGLSNIFTTDIEPNSSRKRTYIKRDAPAQTSSLGNNTELYNKLRSSVGQIQNSVLGSMVCGQDNTALNTANVQLTAGKVPRDNLQNTTFNVNGMDTKFPFNSSSFGDIDCMDTKIALQPTDLYHDSSSSFVSHIASVTVGANGNDFSVHNLSEPIEMVFPIYDYPTLCNATSNCTNFCQFLNETSNQWESDGCTVFSSNKTHVVCHCDHLTSFSVQFKDSLNPLKDAGKLIKHPSFANLRDRPTPIIFIAAIFAVYIVAMGFAIHYDRKRGFYDIDVPLPLSESTQNLTQTLKSSTSYDSNPYSPRSSSPSGAALSPEMSVPSISVTPYGGYMHEFAPPPNSPTHAPIPPAFYIPTTPTTPTGRTTPTNFTTPTGPTTPTEITPPSTSLTLSPDARDDEEDDEYLGDAMLAAYTGGSVRSRSGDAMLNASSDFGSVRSHTSVGSTVGRKSTMGRRSMRGSIRRKSLMEKEEEEKQARERHLAKVASGEHAKAMSEKDFSASLEAVDKVYGVAEPPPKLTRWQEFKLDVSFRVKTNHRYFRIFFRKSGDPFSRARRVTVLLNVIITCLACNAIFYNAKHTDEHIPIGEKILIAFWSSLLIAPVNLAVFFMLSKAGFRYPPMDVQMDDLNNSQKPPPFKPSRLLRREQQELNRIKFKYEELCDKVFNMSIDQAVKMGKVGRERLMELVELSRAQLAYVAARVQERHDDEYYVYLNPPPPGKFSKIKAKLTGEWPWWWAIIGYVFSLLVVVFSVYICLIYANAFTKSALNGWLVSSAIAIAQDIILNQPLASVGGAIFGIFLGSVVNKFISSLGGLIKDN